LDLAHTKKLKKVKRNRRTNNPLSGFQLKELNMGFRCFCAAEHF
jgi:hypothetical protein